MPTTLISRLTLVVVGFFILVTAFSAWRWLTWSPQQFFNDRLSLPANLASQSDQASSNPSRMVLNALSWETEDVSINIEHVNARFSVLSVLLGRPQITELRLRGVEWVRSEPGDPDHIRQLADQLLALSPQQLTLNDMYLALGSQVLQLEGAARRLGASDRFQWHLAGWFSLAGHQGQINLGGSLRQAEGALLLTSLEADTDLEQGPLSGRWELKARSLLLAETRLDWSFLSWAGRWQPADWVLSESLEWAGGIDSWRISDTSRFGRIDSAIAFRDSRQQQHRVSLISTGLEPDNGGYRGPLSLSYRVEALATENQPYGDTTLALEGRFQGNRDGWNWHAVNLLLGMTLDDASNTIRLDARHLTFDPASRQFELVDGQWRHDLSGEPPQLYGYSQMSGQWPALTLTEAPDVATELNHYLTQLGQTLEWMDALQAALVSATGS